MSTVVPAVVLLDEKYTDEARTLANRLGTELLETLPGKDILYVCFESEGVFLCCDDLRMQGDFSHMTRRVCGGKLQHEMLAKVARLKNVTGIPKGIDATAGMGEDSMILAAAGFDMLLYEYDPVIAALLRDALRRAAGIPELAAIASRMTVVEGDSIEAMNSLGQSPDLILLDPMFPKREKSGLIKKKFQLLQKLEQPCSNEDELIKAAIKAAPKKIVIKRPLKGPFLGGIKPDYSTEGKAIRYDCIININGNR